MDSKSFVIWLRGFTEACNDYTATPKQWDRIKEVLDDVEDYDDNPGIDVEDYDDNPGIDVEIDGWDDWYQKHPQTNIDLPLSGSISTTSINLSSGSSGTFYTSKAWNDQMGCWHYTNYPEGFGYYTNSTVETKKEKQQLND